MLPFYLGACSQASEVKFSQEDVLEVEKEIAQAVLSQDHRKVDSLLHKDYIFTIPNEVEVSKTKYLKDMQEWWHPSQMEHQKQVLTIHAHLARVVGEVSYAWERNGEKGMAREKYTDLYVWQDNTLQRFSSHTSCLAGQSF